MLRGNYGLLGDTIFCIDQIFLNVIYYRFSNATFFDFGIAKLV